MGTRLIGTDDADPRLPALVIAATQGTTSADLAPGDVLGTTTTWASPIAGGITVGSGTTTASYARVGKVVVATFRFVLGAGSAVTGDISLTLPVTSAVTGSAQGVGYFEDVSATLRHTVHAFSTSTTSVTVRPLGASTTYTTLGNVVTAAVPFTWATSDVIAVTVSYLGV